MAKLDTTTFQQQLAETTAHEFYGVKVMWVGEDGEVLVLGHPGLRRAIAAANKLARKDAQLLNLADDRGVFLDDVAARPLWVIPTHNHDCKYVRAFYSWCHEDKPAAEQPPAVEPGDQIREGQDCDCVTAGDREWHIRYVEEGTPGAFAVTKVGF